MMPAWYQIVANIVAIVGVVLMAPPSEAVEAGGPPIPRVRPASGTGPLVEDLTDDERYRLTTTATTVTTRRRRGVISPCLFRARRLGCRHLAPGRRVLRANQGAAGHERRLAFGDDEHMVQVLRAPPLHRLDHAVRRLARQEGITDD